MITANAGNDAGGIATFASVGAEFGYSLLWVLIPIAISLGIVQEMCARTPTFRRMQCSIRPV
jgi:Mn2+/Fe2+ NRAMP family transporter